MHTVVSAEEDGKFRCVLCSKVYARSSAFYGHLSVHAINDTLSCAMCNEEYEYQVLYLACFVDFLELLRAHK